MGKRKTQEDDVKKFGEFGRPKKLKINVPFGVDVDINEIFGRNQHPPVRSADCPPLKGGQGKGTQSNPVFQSSLEKRDMREEAMPKAPKPAADNLFAGQDETESIAGVVEKVVFKSPGGTFSVLRFRADGDLLNATLPCLPPPLKKPVTLFGQWTVHPRFGLQFAADYYQSDEESTAEAELRELILWLRAHGGAAQAAAKLFKAYGSSAIEIVQNAPFRPVSEGTGLDFATADRIARSLGCELDDAERLGAGIDYVLNNIAYDGHTCLPRPELIERAARLLDVGRPLVDEYLNDGGTDFFTAEINGTIFYYPFALYDAETEVAARIAQIQKHARPLSVESPRELVAEWESKSGIKLSQGQAEAMMAALTCGVFCLTGGPGTGKTTVVRGMLELLKARGLNVRLAAPTGRAAKRLAEATGSKAETIHRLLGASFDETEESSLFAKDEDEPLEANAIIVDEASMIDIVLMHHLLIAVPHGCHIIFVGDASQLPAVGPGNVLGDILRSRAVPTVWLRDIFRQAQKSPIVMNAHAINSGRRPWTGGLESEFAFLRTTNERETARLVVELATSVLPQMGYDAIEDIEVLSPMHRGVCGVAALNGLLQERLNPPQRGKAEFAAGSFSFRVGDKVMQIRNDYEKDVFNGDIGRLTRIDGGKLTVVFDGEKPVRYEKSEIDDLVPAYAMTVHKSQGSEYPVVVLALADSQFIMLRRNLLYTAVTRAKERVVLVGSERALMTAVGGGRTLRRYSLLGERLSGAID